jgi:hypothetical protein
VHFDVLLDLHGAPRRKPEDPEPVVPGQVPEVLKEGAGINVAPAKLKLDHSNRRHPVPHPFENCQFMPLNIELHPIHQPGAVSQSVLVKTNFHNLFGEIRLEPEVLDPALNQRTKI